MSDLIQHAYARPIGGGPCVECGQPADSHEPLPRFVSITRQEEESLKAGLPAWMAPLWDGIHAWAANLRTASLKKCTEALAKRVEHIPAQYEAVSFISVVVERAVAAEGARIRRELLATIEEDRTDLIEGEPVEGFWLRTGLLVKALDRIVPKGGVR